MHFEVKWILRIELSTQARVLEVWTFMCTSGECRERTRKQATSQSGSCLCVCRTKKAAASAGEQGELPLLCNCSPCLPSIAIREPDIWRSAHYRSPGRCKAKAAAASAGALMDRLEDGKALPLAGYPR
eukprot:scaffold269396_cov17-Tisochrysis_lutea.AAC.1